MPNILDVRGLTKSFGARDLFRGLTFALEEGEKVGIIGVNGSGKSPLVRILAGEEGHEEGTIAMRRGARVGYLPQEPKLGPTDTVLGAAAGGNREVEAAVAEYHRVAAELAAGPGDARLLARHGELAAQLDAFGAWELEHRAEAVLTRLGITEFDRPVRDLSGGERPAVEDGLGVFS
jgi:ABC transport system ATP-binding/permease protein